MCRRPGLSVQRVNILLCESDGIESRCLGGRRKEEGGGVVAGCGRRVIGHGKGVGPRSIEAWRVNHGYWNWKHLNGPSPQNRSSNSAGHHAVRDKTIGYPMVSQFLWRSFYYFLHAYHPSVSATLLVNGSPPPLLRGNASHAERSFVHHLCRKVRQ